MKKNEVYDMFYSQDKIKFNKGYEIFEEVYEELKDKLKLKREEKKEAGLTVIIVTKGE